MRRRGAGRASAYKRQGSYIASYIIRKLEELPWPEIKAKAALQQKTIDQVIKRSLRHWSAASYGDCIACDGYIIEPVDSPYCPTCARLMKEGKPL